MQETQVLFLGWEDFLETERATHSSILTWEIPWTEEPGGLHSMGLLELDMTEVTEHTHTHTHTHTHPGHRTDTMVSSGVIQTYINYRVITVLQSLGLCTPSYTWKHFSLRYPNDSVSPPWESLFSFHILWPQHLRFKPLCIFFVLFLFFCFIFLAVMGLCCRTQAFSSYSESGLLFIAVFRLLIAVASFVAEQGRTWDRTHVPCIARRIFNYWTTRKTLLSCVFLYNKYQDLYIFTSNLQGGRNF